MSPTASFAFPGWLRMADHKQRIPVYTSIDSFAVRNCGVDQLANLVRGRFLTRRHVRPSCHGVRVDAYCKGSTGRRGGPGVAGLKLIEHQDHETTPRKPPPTSGFTRNRHRLTS